MANDWTLDIGPYYVGASRSGHTRVGLCFDDGYLEVDLEAGSAYMREHLTVSIPVIVLAKLLEARGYRVNWEPGFTSPTLPISPAQERSNGE